MLELRLKMGKSGYVPTEHRWEDDGAGEDLTDEHGQVPADLAAELRDTARQHVDETNESMNYRIVALRNVEGGQEYGGGPRCPVRMRSARSHLVCNGRARSYATILQAARGTNVPRATM